MKGEQTFVTALEANRGIIFKVANAYCKRSEERQDLVQEIIYHLWRSFPQYDSSFRFSTWMYRIALNVAISYYRKTKTHGIIQTIENDSLEIQETVPNENDYNIQLLEKFIHQLKELDRALMLLYLDQKSHKEIADILGITESNVGTKVGRIKKILAEKFKNQT